MRLIDADALRKQILETYEYEFPTASGAFDEFATRIVPNIINNAPSADAAPVVRGEWVEAKSGVMSVWPPGQVMCSVCGQRMPSQWKKMPPYCYGCGAKMESEGNT